MSASGSVAVTTVAIIAGLLTSSAGGLASRDESLSENYIYI